MNENFNKRLNKKNIIYLGVCIGILVLGVTLAYFAQIIVGEGTTFTTQTEDFRIIFTDGADISNSTVEPGWTATKTFTVENKSDSSYTYNLLIEDLVNELPSTGYLQYQITSTNSGFATDGWVNVPQRASATDTFIGYNISIAANTTQTYTMNFHYLSDSDNNQLEDMGKTFSGKLGIKESVTLYEAMLSNSYSIDSTRDSASLSSSVVSYGSNKLYKTTEQVAGDTGAKTVYYYSGSENSDNRINNWVKFGKEGDNDIYWRIIRTNADGSVRLLYHGTSTTSTSAYIGTSGYASAYDDPMYVGWMYGTTGNLDNNRANTNSSAAKIAVEEWYSTNIASNSTYSSKVSSTAVYCNDRSMSSDTTTWGTYTTSTSVNFNYGMSERIGAYSYSLLSYASNYSPSYNCTVSADAFTADNGTSNIGNELLTYPVGLMSIDELTYSGGIIGHKLANPMWYALNSNLESSTGSTQSWTMTPLGWYRGRAMVIYVAGSITIEDVQYLGLVNQYYATVSYGLRPVISVKGDTIVTTGNGSYTTPYEI